MKILETITLHLNVNVNSLKFLPSFIFVTMYAHVVCVQVVIF